jgi:hypothetical protein
VGDEPHGLEGTHYVLGRLKQTTTAVTLRLSYTLTPNLSLQLYGQPFASAGHYENYKELRTAAARAHRSLRPYAYDGNADFTVLSFRTTNVLRWEYKPARAVRRLAARARRVPTRQSVPVRPRLRRHLQHAASNTVLVKLSYWLNP